MLRKWIDIIKEVGYPIFVSLILFYIAFCQLRQLNDNVKELSWCIRISHPQYFTPFPEKPPGDNTGYNPLMENNNK